MEVLKATKADKTKVIDILAKSFDTNNSANWSIIKDAKRKQRLRALIDYCFELSLMHNGVFITEDGNGAMLTMYPNKVSINFFKQISLDIRLAFKAVGVHRVPKVLKREAYIKKFHPEKENFIYLWFIGVVPEMQGKGIGSAMMRFLLKKAEQENVDLYLETSDPKNLDIYKHFGLKVFHEWDDGFMPFKIYFLRYKVS